jgi:hypothetical protein
MPGRHRFILGEAQTAVKPTHAAGAAEDPRAGPAVLLLRGLAALWTERRTAQVGAGIRRN